MPEQNQKQHHPNCPCCGHHDHFVFHSVDNVPVHSVMNIDSRDKAIAFPRGSIQLALCRNCGFISNQAFDPELLHYGTGYEATQAYSPTFGSFARRLADKMVQTHDLYAKKVLEIGCGNGEFLQLVCNAGGGEGIGFDPAYDTARSPCAHDSRISIVKDFYSQKYANVAADFIYCRMTLEHIPDVSAFVQMVRQAIGERSVPVLFQVPNAHRILEDCAFEDIYYEHCSYFTAESLQNLFRRCGFRPKEVSVEYGNQYVFIVADPVTGTTLPITRESLPSMFDLAERFGQCFQQKHQQWCQRMDDWARSKSKVVLWGSGSKAVSFLSSVPSVQSIEYTVDINPFRQDHYLAGTGHRIVNPHFLTKYRPDAVIVMNRMYTKEITDQMTTMGISPEVHSL